MFKKNKKVGGGGGESSNLTTNLPKESNNISAELNAQEIAKCNDYILKEYSKIKENTHTTREHNTRLKREKLSSKYEGCSMNNKNKRTNTQKYSTIVMKTKKLAILPIAMFLLVFVLGLLVLLNANPTNLNRNVGNNAVSIGTAENPNYTISSEADLIALSTKGISGNQNFSNAWGTSSTSYYILLTQDIVVTAIYWSPIGTDSDLPFRSIFDGGGHTITFVNPITIKNATGTIYGGLFGYTNVATIKNLGINWQGGLTVLSSSFAYAGGIVGYAYDTRSIGGGGGSGADIICYAASGSDSAEISNCFSFGNVTASSTDSYAYAGGIVGYARGGVEISNCFSSSGMTATSTNSYAIAGSIVGYIYGGSVSNCFNSGNVNAESTNERAVAGGIVGSDYDGVTISNCYNTGSVDASGSSSTDAGGIVGYARGGSGSAFVRNCFSSGSVSATAKVKSACAGGIVGNTSVATINNCYNTGDITAEYTGTSADYYASAGGIAGNLDIIVNCFSINGIISATSPNSTNTEYVGGIVGRVITGTLSTNNYYNNTLGTTDATDSGAGTLVSATGDNSLDNLMKVESNFTSGSFSDGTKTYNWDTSYAWVFTDTWIIDENYNIGLPIIKNAFHIVVTYANDAENASEFITKAYSYEELTSGTIVFESADFFTKEGYNLSHWTDGENNYECGGAFTLTDNKILYAVWQEPSITITFNASNTNVGNNTFVYILVNNTIVRQGLLNDGTAFTIEFLENDSVSIIITGKYLSHINIADNANIEKVGNVYCLLNLEDTTIIYTISGMTSDGLNNSIIV